jgi:cyclase
MLSVRVIPIMLVSDRRLVKTKRFKAPKYVGDPINIVRIYNEKEVDELFVADIGASREGRGPDFEFVRRISSEAFMPICYAGGVSTVEQAHTLMRVGVEKIAINTAALRDPNLIRCLADRFGSQCVVASIDVKRTLSGRYVVFSHAGVRLRHRDPVALAQALVQAGAGEVLLNNVDRDGTMAGFDRQLLHKFKEQLSAPLVAAGGAASTDDIIDTLDQCRLSGVAVGARFVFYGPHRAVLVTYPEPAELARLRL